MGILAPRPIWTSIPYALEREAKKPIIAGPEQAILGRGLNRGHAIQFDSDHVANAKNARACAGARHGVWKEGEIIVSEVSKPRSVRPPRAERPRCCAITRTGTPCMMAALWLPSKKKPHNGRRRIHGGLSTGPKTEAGKAAIAENNKRRAAPSAKLES